MSGLVGYSELDDVLRTLRIAALFTPGRELTADEVASTCWISRPPSCFQMNRAAATEALKELVKDGYAASRRARTSVFKLDPSDRRAPLPNGFRYARRLTMARAVYDVVATPEWGNSSRVELVVSGDSVAISPLFQLTWRHQRGGARPLTEAQARLWISSLKIHGWIPDGEHVRCALSNGPGLRAMAKLASDLSYKDAAVVTDRAAIEGAVERGEREERLRKLTAHWGVA